MGSRLSTLDKGDAAGPLQNVEFFQTIRAKWMEYFISKLNENILSDLDISKKNEMLQWRDYFNIFAEIRGFVDRDNDIKQRLHWHPATAGFMLQQELPRAPARPASPQPRGLDDDYTEDEASDVSDSDQESIVNDGKQDDGAEEDKDKGDKGIEEEEEEEGGAEQDGSEEEDDGSEDEGGGEGVASPPKKAKFSPPPHWNPEHMSPIFYGYSDLTVKAYGENIQGAKEDIARSEERAVQKALTKRLAGLAEYEQSIRAKEAKRQEKIERISAAYVEARDRREETMSKEKIIMPPVGFRVYKVREGGREGGGACLQC
jgi:hypothetical protein